MPLLRCEGVFAVPVPAGWEVHGVPGSYYVFTPAERGRHGGEVRFAVFPREPGPLGEREGADRLTELLAELDVDTADEDIAFTARYGAEAHRAFAWFQAYDADGHDVDCLAAVVVLSNAVIACTAMASPRRPEIVSTAEMLVASMSAERRGGRP